MVKRQVLEFDRPRLFSSTFTRRVLDDSGAVLNKNAQDLVGSNVASTSSFRYDPPFLGIRSTQQIPVDFSLFENHTFFNSAEVNVNVAFDRIINEFPFDGTQREVEAFLDSLTGFEKYVFDEFPKNVGYLNFDGSAYIEVRDFAGNLFPSISKVTTGDNVLDPGSDPFTVEMHLFVPEQANLGQIVCQKISGSAQGITLALTGSTSTSTCGLTFGATSGSRAISATTSITKGQFNHIVASFDRRPGINDIKLYVNEELEATSSNVDEMGQIQFQTSPFFVGTGSVHDGIITPEEVLSGAIDELRVFHDIRTVKQQQLFGRKSIFQTPELKLYFRFNEPTGSIGSDTLVIDSSGNALHAAITNFVPTLRTTSSIEVPMTSEKRALQPVLFPAFGEVQTFNMDLLASASAYDELNPNLITRLVPDHYFLEGQCFEGLQQESGTIGDTIGGEGPPGTAELGTSQLMASFLYVWAKFFDEIKMMLDLFGRVVFVDYDKPGFIADQFLPFLAKYYGFEMPGFFIDSSVEQFIDAENITDSVGTSELSLQFVQNQIWRRILTNIGEVIRSKGTLHSIKVLFRSMGIEPDSNFRIREFGGPTKKTLGDARDQRSDISTLLDFSGTLNEAASTLDAHGVPDNKPFIRSPFLSGSRYEPGFPEINGTFVPISDDLDPALSASDDPSDGLFTSGSFTYEALYRFPRLVPEETSSRCGILTPLGTVDHPITQSLVRMSTTGSADVVSGSGGLIFNLTAISGSDVTLYVSPGVGGAPNPSLILPLTGADIMDGRQWSISFGRQRADEIGAFVSSSYFLRAIRQEFGQIVESHTTSSLFFESGSGASVFNVLEVLSPTHNASGPFLTIGSQSIETAGIFLNNTAIEDQARATEFDGRVGQIRFWSKALTLDESFEHARNFRSVGVEDPRTNFNFVVGESGSFEKIRIDASLEQPTSESNADGTFEVFDFSQNDLHLTGSGFEASVNVLAAERFFFSQLSPRFDEAASSNKVRIRSFQSFENVQLHGGAIAPIHEIPRSEIPEDDVRFSIDFSIMDALDEDIVRIFSTFDLLDNSLGSPELVFSPDYPDLESLRDVYFNRLTDKVRLKKFFEFFKWFDSILGITQLIEQLVPRKTKFLGTNFIIESHMLERPKFEYLYTDIYLGENDRHGLKGTIILQQFAALLKKF